MGLRVPETQNGQKRKGGRKPKLTPEKQEHIIKLLRIGNTYQNACRLAKIGETTLYKWLDYGNPESPLFKSRDPRYRKFRDAVMEALAEIESEHVENVRKGGQKDWKASMEWLNRRRPKEWSVKQRIEQLNANINIDLSQLTDDDLARLADGEPVSQVIRMQRSDD